MTTSQASLPEIESFNWSLQSLDLFVEFIHRGLGDHVIGSNIAQSWQVTISHTITKRSQILNKLKWF